MNYKDFVYIDIETVGNYPNLDELRFNDARGYDLFIRKIERKSPQFIDWKEDPYEVYKNKSPLLPEFGKIVCVSIATIKNDETILKSIYDEDEKILISKVQRIFKNISDKTLLGVSGFYIKGFDIPWLNRKMLKYGLEIPKVLRNFNVKPWEMNIADIAELWKNYSTLENVSFDEMLYVLEIDSPKSIMAGKDVHNNYWYDRNIEKIKTYCEGDVIACVNAAKKIFQLL